MANTTSRMTQRGPGLRQSAPFDIDARINVWSQNRLDGAQTEQLLKSTSPTTFFKRSAMCQEMIDSMSDDELGECLVAAIGELLSRTGVDAE